MAHNFRNLKVWNIAIELVVEVYMITKTFPSDEKFGLISQINRSAISVPSNIAEGSGRSTSKDFQNFMRIALSSLYELETQIEVSNKIGYLTIEKYTNINERIVELEKMMFGFIKSLEK